MPNSLTISVEAPDQILNAGLYGAGAVIRVQTSATEAGAFTDVTGTGSTPTIAVVTNVRSYTGYDPAGIVSSWYRTRFENVGATRLSDWSPAFQVGDETAGLLCSLADVSQEMFGTATVSANDQESILEHIRQVSDDIEDYVGQWLAPRPTNPASTTTLLFDVEYSSWVWRQSLLLRSGQRICGIRTLTALGIATTSQPESGGTYSAATLADVFLRPRPTADGPALRLEFTDNGGGYFYPGYNTAQVTGSFGPAAVAPRIQAVAIEAVKRRFLGKEGVASVVGPDGGVQLLRGFSPDMRATLDRIRIPAVA